jgi:hypothetical protein
VSDDPSEPSDDGASERIRAIRARHYAKHAARCRAQSKAWRAANPEQVRANNARRRRRQSP